MDQPPNGTFNLIINSVKEEDAGRYDCQDDGGFGDIASAQLVVLTADPVCRTTTKMDEVVGPNSCQLEPDKPKLSCIVSYHGNVAPVMEWTATKKNVSSFQQNVSKETYDKNITYHLMLNVDLSINGSTYSCQTTKSTSAQINCSLDPIIILYAFGTNFSINSSITEEVICSANSSQSCSYKWKWFRDADVTTESNNASLKPSKAGWHRCEAECILKTQSCSLQAMLAHVNHTHVGKPLALNPDSGGLKTVLLAVLITLPITFAIVAVIIFFRKRKRKRKLKESNESRDKKERLSNTEALSNLLEPGHPDSEDKIKNSATFVGINDDVTNDVVILEFDKNRAIEEKLSDLEVLSNLLKRDHPAIFGLASLDDEVFISRLQQSCVEAYDSETFKFKRRFDVDGMSNPEHIVSCSINKCLYAFDWNSDQILRINSNDGGLLNKWEAELGGGRMSVARDSNIILNVNFKSMLIEYTADGERVCIIDLESGTGIFRAWHALKLRNGLFVVCHGRHGDPQSRVCLLRVKEEPKGDNIFDTQLIKTFVREEGSTLENLNLPLYLATDNKESIVVCDYGNKRALLLNTSLENSALLISDAENVNGFPWRVCYDEIRSRWLVADYDCVSAIVFVNGAVLKTETYFLSNGNYEKQVEATDT